MVPAVVKNKYKDKETGNIANHYLECLCKAFQKMIKDEPMTISLCNDTFGEKKTIRFDVEVEKPPEHVKYCGLNCENGELVIVICKRFMNNNFDNINAKGLKRTLAQKGTGLLLEMLKPIKEKYTPKLVEWAKRMKKATNLDWKFVDPDWMDLWNSLNTQENGHQEYQAIDLCMDYYERVVKKFEELKGKNPDAAKSLTKMMAGDNVMVLKYNIEKPDFDIWYSGIVLKAPKVEIQVKKNYLWQNMDELGGTNRQVPIIEQIVVDGVPFLVSNSIKKDWTDKIAGWKKRMKLATKMDWDIATPNWKEIIPIMVADSYDRSKCGELSSKYVETVIAKFEELMKDKSVVECYPKTFSKKLMRLEINCDSSKYPNLGWNCGLGIDDGVLVLAVLKRKLFNSIEEMGQSPSIKNLVK